MFPFGERATPSRRRIQYGRSQVVVEASRTAIPCSVLSFEMEQIRYARQRKGYPSAWHIIDPNDRARCGVSFDPPAQPKARWEVKAVDEMEGPEFLRLCPNCAKAGPNRAALYSHEARQDQAMAVIGESLTRQSQRHGGAAIREVSDRWRNRPITRAQEDRLNALDAFDSSRGSWTRGRASDEIDRLLKEKEGS
jgi:hypothetical protein